MVLTDKRLNVKEGTHKTLLRVREDDKTMVPMCVTEAVSPLGNSTMALVIAVIEDNAPTEHIMWSVAPVSMTQVSELKALLFTTLAEKIE